MTKEEEIKMNLNLYDIAPSILTLTKISNYYSKSSNTPLFRRSVFYVQFSDLFHSRIWTLSMYNRLFVTLKDYSELKHIPTLDYLTYLTSINYKWRKD